MSELLVRPPRLGDVEALAATMRAADREELVAAHGWTPLWALMRGLEDSTEVWTVVADGKVAAMYGVVELGQYDYGERWGIGWLLTSDLVETHKRAFWRACKLHVADLFTRWDGLYNAIDCRHEKAIRWAKRLGFELFDPAPYGIEGLEHQAFLARKEAVECALRQL